MDFRARLLATLRAARPVLEVPGVLVVGSEVPNLLEPAAAATLVVSRDVDLAVPVGARDAVKRRLGDLTGLRRSPDEPSVWIPEDPDLIEVNFVGVDPALTDPGDAYVLEDADLPLLVFGALSLVRPREPVVVEDLRLPVPRLAGLLVEKLLTDRSGEKGARDLLVALALLVLATEADLAEAVTLGRSLPPEHGHAVRSNLTLLSLLDPLEGMPDPRPRREMVAALLARLDAGRGG